jgi:hypothetical protein
VETKLPGAEPYLPGMEPYLAGVETKLPGVETKLPGMETKFPCGRVEVLVIGPALMNRTLYVLAMVGR